MIDILIGFILAALIIYIKESIQSRKDKRKFKKLCDDKKFFGSRKSRNDKQFKVMRCNFPDDGCVHTSTSQKGSCDWCKLYY